MVYEFFEEFGNGEKKYEVKTDADKDLAYKINFTIKKVGDDIARFSFNTAISAVMELVNAMYKYREEQKDAFNVELFRFAVVNLVVILSPFTPHVCEEMWQHMEGEGLVYDQLWPEFDEAALVKDTVEIVVQINGKVKDKMSIPADAGKEDMEKAAMESDKIKELTAGKNIVKVIAVPGKLVNIVAK
jgi:leucyl-tRNA synthetase